MTPQPEQQEFWAPYRGWPPYVMGSETSFAAAEQIESAAAVLRERVYAAICVLGRATDEQLQQYLGMEGNTERPRRCELVAAGRVRDSGRRAKTQNHRKAVLWEATPRRNGASAPPF